MKLSLCLLLFLRSRAYLHMISFTNFSTSQIFDAFFLSSSLSFMDVVCLQKIFWHPKLLGCINDLNIRVFYLAPLTFSLCTSNFLKYSLLIRWLCSNYLFIDKFYVTLKASTSIFLRVVLPASHLLQSASPFIFIFSIVALSGIFWF